jgi:hypothetical protein
VIAQHAGLNKVARTCAGVWPAAVGIAGGFAGLIRVNAAGVASL